MAFQTWIADVLRAAGLPVVEEPGWRTRSSSSDTDASSYSPLGLVAHETRGSATSTVAGEIRVLIEGRVGLAGPISQTFLSRAGVWHVVAAGLCHHVKTGWGGAFSGYGNTRLFGVEAQHAESESWAAKPEQYAAYVRGVAAICKHKGWTVDKVVGHKEHQPGDKPDPEFSMDRFRADVRAVMEGDMDQADKNMATATTYRTEATLRHKDNAKYTIVVDGKKVERVEENELKKVVDTTAAGVAELLLRPPVEAGPVDALVLKALFREVLAEPEVLAAIASAVADEDHRRSAG